MLGKGLYRHFAAFLSPDELSSFSPMGRFVFDPPLAFFKLWEAVFPQIPLWADRMELGESFLQIRMSFHGGPFLFEELGAAPLR